MEFNCLIKNFDANGDTFRQYADHLTMYLDGNFSGDRWYFGENGFWSEQVNQNNKLVVVASGRWECDGDDNFKFIDETNDNIYSSKTNEIVPIVTTQPTDTYETRNSFSCIQNNKGNAAKVDSNGESVWFWVDEPNRVAHIFYKKDNKWVQSKNGTEQFTGRWNCDENNHFLIVSNDGQSYSSRNDNWEKVTSIGDINDSFPLKFGSRGPNVVKLQKFLNDKIRTNPLTVNGIFDQKTQDKLIEFQKKEGIIQ